MVGAGFTLLGLFVALCWLVVLAALMGFGRADLRDREWLVGLCLLAGLGGAGLWCVLWWVKRALRAVNTNVRLVLEGRR